MAAAQTASPPLRPVVPSRRALAAAPAAPAPSRAPRARLDFPHSLLAYAPDQQIYGEDDDATFVYVVVSGTVRTCKFRLNGRRQVEAFHGEGDVFGLEGGSRHLFSAEAVSDCAVAAYRRHHLASVALKDGRLSELLFSFAARGMLRAQEHAILLGAKTALERVASFLMAWAARSGGGAVAELTMARQDIADYLGLTIETVSRSFTILEQRRLIVMHGPRLILLTGLTSRHADAA
jgi:CRP/FNR family nitrogen fixation transcriptional regulator